MTEDDEQPAWLNNSRGDGNEPLNKSGNKSSSASAVTDNGSKAQETGTAVPSNKNSACKRVVKAIFLIINLSLMTMMSATGVLGIKNSSSITDTSTVIVGLYMILFSAILVIYEIIQIYPCSLIDNAYKRNFGFLYGLMGKSGFTVFMAVLSFGITDPQQLAFATGILVGLWGIIQFLVYMKFPDYFDKKEKFVP